jgi:stage II sporulation protein D
MRRFASTFLLTLAFCAASSAQTAAPPSDAIRVRLFERESPRCVALASDEVRLHTREGRPATLVAASATVCALDAETVRVSAGGETLFARRVEAEAGELKLTLEGGSDPGLSRTYPGSVAFAPDGDGLLVINTADLDRYVAGVVTHEYGLEDDAGTEAMAIVARTYALRMQAARGAGRPYDVVDHTGDQVYRGVGDASARAREAARRTSGMVVTYGGALAQTVYSSSNGGHSASNEHVWTGTPLPYLRARPDPYDRVSPVHTWQSRLDRGRVLRALSAAAGRDVTGWTIGDRTADGRVATINLHHGSARSTMPATRFRSAISAQMGVHALRSTLFDATRDGDHYAFEGRGYGHGVGMSQWGAHGMARQGKTARDILAFYYPGTQIENVGAAERLATSHAPQQVKPASARPQAPASTSNARRIGW